MRTQMNRQIKEQQKQVVAEAKHSANNKVRETAMESKQDKAATRERLEMQRRAEEQKAQTIKAMVMQQKEEARNQRAMDQLAR